jgi:hypothetical protein
MGVPFLPFFTMDFTHSLAHGGKLKHLGRFWPALGNSLLSFIDIFREGVIIKIRIEQISSAVSDFGDRIGIL